MDLRSNLEIAKNAAHLASEKILEIYESDDFSVEIKGDNSPLTKADKASHQIITEILNPTGLPVLSEEGKDIPFDERKEWEYFWMVDPIDGTKEFIKRNGEFTVNIALIHKNRPVLGVVLVPVSNDIFCAVKGQGATKNGQSIEISQKNPLDPGPRVVASRSHLNDETKLFIEKLDGPEIVSKGSSLKLLMVAEGEAELYPRYAPTMEWDTAAAHIIVEEAGGLVNIADSQEPLVYNKENLLNPFFLCANFIDQSE